MDPRIRFAKKHISSKEARILEIGPLNRQIARKEEYQQSYTCDIRTTEEVKELYCGNDYLKATGISVDAATIVDIDYVIKGSYEETFQGEERFDYVIASHVLEHVTDIISFFGDIATILKPGGKMLLVYPDKRFCFDHFRESTTFSEAYVVYKNDEKTVAPRVLDFFMNVVHENSPLYFWENYHALSLLPALTGKQAIEKYEEMLQGIKPDDVHYWPFSSEAFLRFLYDLTRTGLLPFTCADFEDTPMNDQQFFLAMQMDMSVPANPEHAMLMLMAWLQRLVDTSLNPDARVCETLHEIERLRNLADDLAREKEQTAQSLESERNEKQKWMADYESMKQVHLLDTEEIHQKTVQLIEREQFIVQQQNIIGNQQETIGQQRDTINQHQNTIGQQLSTIGQQRDTIGQHRDAMERQQKTISAQVVVINQQIQEKGLVLNELNTVFASFSWRITKPIRMVCTWFRTKIRRQ
jgi:predicted SAM-dependent methyltransferase